MGVLYTVLPLEPRLNEYLTKLGVSVPIKPSRNPTPREVRSAVQEIADINAETVETKDGLLRQVMLTTIGKEDGAWTLLNVTDHQGEDVPCRIWFEKGWPDLIIEVLIRLAQRCGPLVLIADTGDTPLVVEPHHVAKELFESWR